MQGLTIAKDLDVCLDILGQQASLNIYTQISFCFSLPDRYSHSTILKILEDGLERLSASFPWLAGQVLNEGASKDNAGIFKIKPLGKIPLLVVKDLTNDPVAPAMDAMRQANFPFSMLDEAVIAPCKTLPGSSQAVTSIPVFGIQVNLITGGLLLTFVGQHQTMDMTGQGHMIRLFSKACQDEQFTHEEISSGNPQRQHLIPLLPHSNEETEFAYPIVKKHAVAHSVNTDSAPPTVPHCVWSYFNFSSDSLAALKSGATQSLADSTIYVSTDDALTAFIWQSVIRARLFRLDPTDESTFARAVDVRRYLNVPQQYPGLLTTMTFHTYTLQKLTDESLGWVASALRSAVDPKTSKLEHNTRALATSLDRSPKKKVVSFTDKMDMSTDLMLSSWAKLECHDLDFNLGLGEPEAVRRPRFDPVESLIYLMPKTLHGDIAVAICLRDEDMERLRADEDFAKYGKHVG
ncbi:MAG: hypothetical protein M1821_002016 [Bathelium mastoideum]|nr:MAG: hypothetical protein M1821_002016 [Bathelium mastoideum]